MTQTVFASGVTSVLITQLPQIPGFPTESILIGILLGLIALAFVRRVRSSSKN
jgi:hypothetical protein